MIAFEDMTVGRIVALGPRTVEAKEIVEFAGQFDPQPFHLDPDSEQARQTGGLIASGWHSCAILMRMMCDALLLDSTSEGSAGVEEVRWLAPVRPGDVLTGKLTVTDARVSASRPSIGIIAFDAVLENQDAVPVVSLRSMGFFGLREAKR